MSCERLVCASCAGPVVEGRCQVCRAARAEVHSHSTLGLTPQLVAVLLLAALVITFVIAHSTL